MRNFFDDHYWRKFGLTLSKGNIKVLTYFSFFVSGLGIFALIIMVFASQKKQLPVLLLCGLVFILSFQMLVFTLYQDKSIWQVPHLLRIPSPLTYLVAPLGYLYVRVVLDKTLIPRRRDWFHFLPFGLHFAELIPFYFSSTAEKHALLTRFFSNPVFIELDTQGILPQYVHTILKGILGILYAVFMGIMLHKRIRANDPELSQGVIGWLNLLTFFLFSLSFSVVAGNLCYIYPTDLHFLNSYIIGFFFLCLLFVMFLSPQVLYGTHWTGVQESGEKGTSFELSAEQINHYKHQVTIYLQQNRPYLQQRFSLQDLSNMTQIPKHHLSICLKKGFEMNFNELINQYRIKYILNEFDKNKWLQMTISGLAQEAGFNSDATFYRSFKQVVGKTPSEYREHVLSASENK